MTRERIAFIIAPLTTPITFVIALVGLDFNWDFYDMFETMLMMAIFCIPVAYVVALVFGLPLYIIFKQHKLINILTLTIGAAFVANLPLLLLFLYGAYEGEYHKLLSILPGLSLIGAVVGLTFWIILNINHITKRLKPQGKKSPCSDAQKSRAV